MSDGDRFLVNGQKVWNSAADSSKRGMLLMRTDPDASKREGITFAVIDMTQPGVEVRPLKTMNGRAHFCEVFLADAVVDAADVIGKVNGGWRVARTVLGLERSSASQVDARGLVVVRSGEMAGQLDRRISDVTAIDEDSPKGYTVSALRAKAMIALAEERGLNVFATHATGVGPLLHAHSGAPLESGACQGLAEGRPAGTRGLDHQLVLGRICNMSRDLSFGILGASALLDGPDSPEQGEILAIGLSSPGVTIGAGTDEIQRNTIGEQVLGLPARERSSSCRTIAGANQRHRQTSPISLA